MDGKKVIIIGGGAGIGKSVREAISLSKLEDSGVVVDKVVNNTTTEHYYYEFTRIPDMPLPFNPNQKIRSKYKRNLKYR
jgi:hypothetical protein